MQFGFKQCYSTTLCTGILKTVVDRYIKRSSKVYACLIHAFDTVDHFVLFKKLLERVIPVPIARFLLRWYRSQLVCVRWNSIDSSKFSVRNGVRQGGVLSPNLFTVYVDSLLDALRASGRGCYWHSLFAGAFCYADDLAILAPSADGLRKMLSVCEEFASSHRVRFNPAKIQLICFGTAVNCSCSDTFIFCGRRLAMLDSVVHLGSYLTVNLSDDLDIRMKTMDFIRQANAVLLRFHFADRALKTHLFRSYCLGLYGGALWNLSSGPVRALEVSYNNILRRIWSLPRTAHTAVVHSVAELKSVFNLLYCRFFKAGFYRI